MHGGCGILCEGAESPSLRSSVRKAVQLPLVEAAMGEWAAMERLVAMGMIHLGTTQITGGQFSLGNTELSGRLADRGGIWQLPRPSQ